MILEKKYPDFANCLLSEEIPEKNPKIVKWADVRRDALSLMHSSACRKTFELRDYFKPIAFDIFYIKDLRPLVFLLNRRSRTRNT